MAPALAAPLAFGRVVVTVGVRPRTPLTLAPVVGSMGTALMATARSWLAMGVFDSGVTTMFWVLRLATPVRAWTTPPPVTLMLLVGVVRLVEAASNCRRPPA